MKLTTLTDYAIRMLMYVAQHPDRLCTIAEVAQVYDISQAHLMKVTHRLAQTGWLETVRGKNGGIRLAKPPHEISLGRVIRDTENEVGLTECFGEGSACTLTGNCQLAGVLRGALNQFWRHLDAYTLADILPAKEQFLIRVHNES